MRYRSKLFITIAALGAAPLIAPTLVQSTLTAEQRRESSRRTTAARADQWPRFRGPSSNPVSDNPNLPVSWSKTENVEWVADVSGVGWSSPVVWANRVFITSATAREMYKGRPAGGRHSKNSFASETPITDGKRVYVYLTDYGLLAYDFAGKPSWTTPLTSHATTRDWGLAPLLRCTKIACSS